MNAEFTVEQIREFVKRGYTSVSARMCASMLQHFDDAKVKNEGIRESEKEFCADCGHEYSDTHDKYWHAQWCNKTKQNSMERT